MSWVGVSCGCRAVEPLCTESARAGSSWQGQEPALQPPSTSVPSEDVTVPWPLPRSKFVLALTQHAVTAHGVAGSPGALAGRGAVHAKIPLRAGVVAAGRERKGGEMPPGRVDPQPCPAPGVTWLPSSPPGRRTLPTRGRSSLQHIRSRGAGIHRRRCPRGRSCCSCQDRVWSISPLRPGAGTPCEDRWPDPGHTWVLSSRARSAGRTRSLGRRPPRAGSGDMAGGSPHRGSRVRRAPGRGSRSSQAGRPGRSRPRASRAGCACSSHSCMGRGAVTPRRPPMGPPNAGFTPHQHWASVRTMGKSRTAPNALW